MPLRCPALPEELQLPGEASSVAPARGFVAEALRRLDLDEVVDDAELAVTELVTNVVIHARTPMVVRVRPAGEGAGDAARVEVLDGSPVLPSPGLLSSTAGSGRGLILVDALSARWGADPEPGGGKTVWFEIAEGAAGPVEEPSPEDLLEMWAAFDEEALADAPAEAPVPGEGARVRIVLPGVAAGPLQESRADAEDLLRDLQLLLLGNEGRTGAGVRPSDPVAVARRLDAAARAAENVRSQLRHEALRAVARDLEVVDLELDLTAADAGAALELSDALDEAVRLHAAGGLPAAAEFGRHAEFRRWYLHEIAARARAAAGA